MKLLLTAPPGTGKSTVLEAFINDFQGPVCGVLAKELRDSHGVRTGFIAINSVGASRQFMFRTDKTAEKKVGDYRVDVAAIESFVVTELQRATELDNALIYIDEIGRAQAQSNAFVKTVRQLLDGKRNVLATIVADDEPWSLEFKHHPGVCLVQIDRTNRRFLPRILDAAFSNAMYFHRLAPKQQQYVYSLFSNLLQSQLFVSASKLFNNAICYVAEERVSAEKEEEVIISYKVIGRTRTHKVVWNKQDKTFQCDCDLANRIGKYTTNAEICSHQMSILISREEC